MNDLTSPLGQTPNQKFSKPVLSLIDGMHKRLSRVNWSLLVGGIITLFVLIVAIKGPDWAPKNPMEENYALKIGGKIVRPPYPPLAIDGYLLGTDQFGRDLLSRLLWGVRPTMILVLTVAAVRLVLGIIFGFTIGWSIGYRARIMDSILSVALAIPVLIVALIGISAIGIWRGLWTFIFGMVLTGWAETASIIAIQTRIIKGHTYIEAAHALGASEMRIFFKHVLHHISPLVWMLLAFEVSATLMVTSELGFLGYYIGGGIWIEISDFVAVNTTGLPELGQMLSTALVTLVKPMVLIIVGSFIFVTILGFNLLGEGLRLRTSRQLVVVGRKHLIFGEKFSDWYEDKLAPKVGDWLETNAARLGFACVAILVISVWTFWWESRPVRKPMQDRQYLVVPGGHLWASEYHDAQGTKWTGIVGPKSSDLLWEYQAESGQDENGEPTSGFSGGPVVLADGTIIISTNAKQLIALNENGVVKWIADLPENPVGTPALGPGGEIYVSDKQGGLSSFSPEGTLLWNFHPQGGREATSGPIVASAGMIYYTRVDAVQAVSVAGEPLWLTATSDTYLEEPPKLSAGEGYIFLGDGAMAAASGALLDLEELAVEELIFSTPTFFVGANGETYLRSGHGVIGWRVTDTGLEVDQAITYDHGGAVVVNPTDQGVTPDDLSWLFYAGDYFDTHLVFLDKEGKVLSHVRPPDQQSKMIAIDKDLVAYICSNNFSIQANCQAMVLGEEQPSWVFELGDSVQIAGGALIEGRFYIATKTGLLYAIGDGSELGTVVSETQPAFSSKDQTPATPTQHQHQQQRHCLSKVYRSLAAVKQNWELHLALLPLSQAENWSSFHGILEMVRVGKALWLLIIMRSQVFTRLH